MQPKILNSTLFLARRRFFITFSLSGIVKMRMSPTLKSATLSTRSSADCYTHIQCCCCWDKCLSSCAETQSLRRAKRSRAPINFAKKNDSLSSFALSHVCVDLMFFNFFFSWQRTVWCNELKIWILLFSFVSLSRSRWCDTAASDEMMKNASQVFSNAPN